MSLPVTLLSLVDFSDDQLAKLRAVSPRLEIHQLTDATFETIPEDLRNRVEILYGWGRQLAGIDQFPSLKWVQTHSAGIDSLLDKPIWQGEVLLTTLNGVHTVSMAEHAMAMMLAFRWQLRTMLNFQAESRWPQDRWGIFSGRELRGSTLGLVGYGAIARELARQAQALGMRVLAVNRSGRRRRYRGFREPGVGDLEAAIPEKIYPASHLAAMLPRCDYIVLLAPLTPETRHMVNEASFARMKPEAFFFNLGRGSLVDESALIEALRQGQIAGAGLDVFEEEPLPADSPLWQMENVIISPHVSGFSPTYNDRASDLFAENLRRYLVGQPLLNLVEREKGY